MYNIVYNNWFPLGYTTTRVYYVYIVFLSTSNTARVTVSRVSRISRGYHYFLIPGKGDNRFDLIIYLSILKKPKKIKIK